MQSRTIGILCSFAFVSLHSMTAHAQKTEGALQLALGTDFLTYSKASTTVDVPGGGERKLKTKSFNWGFASRNGVNLEGGYGLTDSLVLGGLLALGGRSDTTKLDTDGANEDTESTFDLTLAPKIDYMFSPDSNLRPFIGGALGITYQSAKTESHNPQTNTTTTGVDASATGLLLMARVGLRWFAAPGFSLDPALMFGWIPFSSGSYKVGATSFDANMSQFSLGLSVAAS
ncbi:MAG TPA: outer membrane beta-barrel protein, partial [Polyangiaceae bacterium]|nr:outer membrane beta-barrel protein [Polyangiaceae bacterium]